MKAESKRVTVAVMGSDDGSAHTALCREIGCQLAISGFAIVTLGSPGVGRIVAESFSRETKDRERLTVFRHPKSRWHEALGVTVRCEDLLDARQQMIKRAEIAVVVSGGTGTREEVWRAVAKGIPVLPLAVTGGAAAQIAAELRNAGHEALDDRIRAVLEDPLIPPRDRAAVLMEAVAKLTTMGASRAASLPPIRQAAEDGVDVAFLTVTRDEYRALEACLPGLQRDPGSRERPNQHAWQTAGVSIGGRGTYRVVLSLAGRVGNVTAALATIETVRRWRPRYVLLVGIAGGLPLDGLTRGDVVASRVIYNYEYGKLTREFQPQFDFTYQVDASLLTAAQTLPDGWEPKVKATPPDGQHIPKVRFGPVASGEKVVDDVTSDFFEAARRAWPKLQAIEMEGAGTAAAIEACRNIGWPVGFLMIRGISDMPITEVSPAATVSQPKSAERDSWTPYAAAAAAQFAVQLLTVWPTPPLSAEGSPGATASSKALHPIAAAASPSRARMQREERRIPLTIQLVNKWTASTEPLGGLERPPVDSPAYWRGHWDVYLSNTSGQSTVEEAHVVLRLPPEVTFQRAPRDELRRDHATVDVRTPQYPGDELLLGRLYHGDPARGWARVKDMGKVTWTISARDMSPRKGDLDLGELEPIRL